MAGEMSHNVPTPTPIGAGIKTNDSVIIGGCSNFGTGGLPIGGYGSPATNAKGNTSDIALLQSLLPGVHITGGNAYQPAAPITNRNMPQRGGGWGSMPVMAPTSLKQQQQQQQQQQTNETWGAGSLYPGAPSSQHVNDT